MSQSFASKSGSSHTMRIQSGQETGRLAFALALALAGTAFATRTQAQEAPAREQPAQGKAAKDDKASTLDTVVVTGKRDAALGLDDAASNGALGTKRLLDTPFSVTVVGADDIAKRKATTLGQVFINDPSVSAAEPPASTSWWGTQIRGLGVYNHYVDGIPVLMQWGGEFPLEPVESVQALKGLGGFMYGFGSPGGIISYTTKKPTDERLLAATIGYRNDSAFSAHVDAGGRLGGPDSLGYRANVAGEHGDAYNGAGIDRTLLSLAVDHAIGSNLTWFAEAFHEDSRLEHEPMYFYWDIYEGDRLPEPTYDYRDVEVRNSYYRSQTEFGTTGLKWRINDDWRAELTLGHSRKRHYSNKMFGDLLNEAGDYDGYVYNFAGDLRNTVVQALAQGQWRTGAIRHELVLGASQQREYERWSNDWYWSNDFSGNLYQRQDYLATHVPDFSLGPISWDERQRAFFASDTLHFGERWQAILGLRRTDYEQKDVDGDPTFDSAYRTRATTPTLALVYKPVDAVSIYGSYVESLEAAGRVPEDAVPPYANAGEKLDATISKQYEVGAKFEGGTFGFTAAAFRVERAAQIDQLRDDGLRYLTQDGLTLYRGIEAIGSVGVTDDLRLGLGAVWLDAGLEDLSPENEALRGNRPAGSSRWQAVANVDYQLRAIAGLSLHGNVRYSGDAYYNDINTVLIPGHTIASAGFQYRTMLGRHPATLTGNVNNLFNRKYWNLDTLGEGINGSLDLRVDF
ncbi:MAG: TonB-dependent siderophore receptor [Thermomonas sp.]